MPFLNGHPTRVRRSQDENVQPRWGLREFYKRSGDEVDFRTVNCLETGLGMFDFSREIKGEMVGDAGIEPATPPV